MKFGVVAIDAINDPTGHWSRDLAQLLVAGLEEAGQDCVLSRNQPEAGRASIVVGAHRIGSPEHQRAFMDADAPYVVVQTARLLGPEMSQPEVAQWFAQSYLPFLRGAAAVWELQPSRMPLLEALGVPSQRLRLGYHSALATLPSKQEQDLDFVFFGTITPHRQAQLVPLQQRGFSVKAIHNEDPFFRDDLLARAKVHVAPRRGDGTARVAPTRLVRILANDGLVVVERGADHHELEDCVVLADTPDFVEACITTIQRPDRAQLAAAHGARFRERSQADSLAPLLEALL